MVPANQTDGARMHSIIVMHFVDLGAKFLVQYQQHQFIVDVHAAHIHIDSAEK